MTSSYITQAVRACRLPIRVMATEDADGDVCIVYGQYSDHMWHALWNTDNATRCYTELRDKLLAEEEMKG